MFSIWVREGYFSPAGDAGQAEGMVAGVEVSAEGDDLEANPALHLPALVAGLHLNLIYSILKFYHSPTG